MTSRIPYLWKECRQSRRLALAALGVFLGISFIPSIIDSARTRGHWYNGNVLAMIFLGGPFLAVIAGVYAMGREQGAIERFWRSRPVSLNRWLLSKYVTGLVLVWLVCWTPLAIQMLGRTFEQAYRPDSDSVGMSVVYSFILLLVYSASFMLGQLVRGVLHAAILAVGAMALIFIMPLTIAPLNWLSVGVLQRVDVGALDLRSCVAFATGMTVLSVALLCLSGILLKRGIRVDADQRTLSWSVVAILLVLAAGVAFPMGTNLTPQQVISLPITPKGAVYDVVVDGNDVLVLLSIGPSWADSQLGLVRVHIGGPTSVDDPVWFAYPKQGQTLYYDAMDLAWSPENPSLAYVTLRQNILENETVKEQISILYTVVLDAKQANPVIHRVELNPILGTQRGVQTACLHQGHLYLYCDEYSKAELLTFSLADPRAPSLVHREDLVHGIGWQFQNSPEQCQIRLAPIPDSDDSARLKITHELAARSWTPAGNGRVLAFAPERHGFALQLVLFETGLTQDSVVPLYPVAQHRAGAIEGLLGESYGGGPFCSDHLACRLSSFGATVYDIRNPKRIARIGHYAAGETFNTIALLPDDRVVIAGNRLHILDLSTKLSR